MMSRVRVVGSLAVGAVVAAAAGAETLTLPAGTFFGPGNTGTHQLVEGQVRNIVLTGPLSGAIPFFNNGPAEPNVIAEVLQGGVVDGYTSNGIAINENIDTALFLDLIDPATGESARLMGVGVAAEEMGPDAKGNLIFRPNIIADPGVPEQALPMEVVFTTGAARVPLSLRTQQGLPGGHDHAGPLPSGRVLIGRIGDFDQDGRLDGVLVMGANTAFDLVVGHGDPLAQYRPWRLDVPIHPRDAAALTANGALQNFPEPLAETVVTRQRAVASDYLLDLQQRARTARVNLRRALHPHALAPTAEDDLDDPAGSEHASGLAAAARHLRAAEQRFHAARQRLQHPRADPHAVLAEAARGFDDVAAALALIVAPVPAR